MKNDCISREAVLESIKNLYPDMPIVDIMGARRKWLDKYAPYFECENVVERLPSVAPEPRMAHRIKHNGVHYDWYECSECGYGLEREITSESGVRFRYCPNCGAKMESEKIDCKSTKCENCINHNYCDYEPQESEG